MASGLIYELFGMESSPIGKREKEEIMQNPSIESYLNCSFTCQCGRTHKSLFAHYIFEPGAIERLPALLGQLGYTRPYLISDTHTDSIRYGKELRDRYTILQLMWDIDRLEAEAGRLVEKYCG